MFLFSESDLEAVTARSSNEFIKHISESPIYAHENSLLAEQRFEIRVHRRLYFIIRVYYHCYVSLESSSGFLHAAGITLEYNPRALAYICVAMRERMRERARGGSSCKIQLLPTPIFVHEKSARFLLPLLPRLSETKRETCVGAKISFSLFFLFSKERNHTTRTESGENNCRATGQIRARMRSTLNWLVYGSCNYTLCEIIYASSLRLESQRETERKSLRERETGFADKGRGLQPLISRIRFVLMYSRSRLTGCCCCYCTRAAFFSLVPISRILAVENRERSRAQKSEDRHF